MNSFILMLTLCGANHYVVIQDKLGMDHGSWVTASEVAKERIRNILLTPDVEVERKSLEEIIGMKCS